MANKQFVGDRASMKLVRVTMGKPHSSIYGNDAIAAGILVTCPEPAPIALLADALPKAFFGLSVTRPSVVARNESHGLPFDISARRVGTLGKGSGLPAATFTEMNYGGVKMLAPTMAANKPHGFAFDSAILATGFCGDSSFSTATTMAKTVGNIIRGIIEGHKKSPFLCLIRERFAVAARSFRVRYSFNCSTSEAI